MIEDHKRQLERVQKAADDNFARTEKRTQAEISDLKAMFNKLEADLNKASIFIYI